MAGGSVTQSVLFELGVTGADGAITSVGNVALKFGALAAAAGIAANAVAGAVSSADQFSDVLKTSDTDMSRFLMTTKGLISTMGAYQNANKLTTAGVRASAEQMAALGKAAVEMSDRMGTDATQEFEKLTDAVIKASTRGLIPYGIHLKTTGDKVKDQAIALEMFTDKFKDFNVEIGNTTELLGALGNTIQTTQDLLVEGALSKLGDTFLNASGGLQSMNSTLQQFNNSLINSEGRLSSWMFSLKGMANTILGVFIEAQRMMPWGRAAAYMSDKFGMDFEFMDFAAQNQYAAEQATKSSASGGGFGGGLSANLRGSASGLSSISMGMAKASVEESTAGLKRGGGGGGGGRKKEAQKTNFTGPEFAMQDFQGDRIAEETARRNAMIDEMNKQSSDRWMEIEAAKMMSKQDIAAQELEIEAQKYAAMSEMQQDFYNSEKQYEEMRAIDKAETASSAVAIMGNQIGSITSMIDTSYKYNKDLSLKENQQQEKHARKNFETVKRLQLAQAAMTLPQAVLNAWNSGMQFGPASIVMAPLLAATTTGLGIAQIAMISKQKFGGDSASASASGGGSVSMPSGGLNNYGGGASGGGGQTIVNNVILDGTVIHSSMIRANDNASQRGEKSFSTAA